MSFAFFEPIEYDGVLTADIFHNYKAYFDAAKSGFIMRKYLISGSPRPELVSHQLYGNPKYYWILLMANDIYDPYYDWVIDEEAVHQAAAQKYQNVGGVYEIAYHVDAKEKRYYRLVEFPVGSGTWYDKGDTEFKYVQHRGTLVPVTNIEHELHENEQKRVIDIISPTDLNRFVDSMKRQMERVRDGR